MIIKPLFNNILIKPLEAETTTAGGIILPDSAVEKPQTGEVMAIGDTDKLKVGNKVLYKKWGGSIVKVEREEWMLIEDKDILAIVEL